MIIKTKRLRKYDRSWMYLPQKDVSLYWASRNSTNEHELNSFFDCCLIWCSKKFGTVKRKTIPDIEWSWNDKQYQLGEYLAFYSEEDNAISIRIQGHRTFYNLGKTIIHEYIHYLQPTRGGWYDRYDKQYGYDKNPYEIEAYHVSGLYAVECTQWAIAEMRPRKHAA